LLQIQAAGRHSQPQVIRLGYRQGQAKILECLAWLFPLAQHVAHYHQGARIVRIVPQNSSG